VQWADDFENGKETLVIPVASDLVQARELLVLVQALREDSRWRDETATESTRESKKGDAVIFDEFLREAEMRVSRAERELRCACVHDLVHDLVAHLLKDEVGLVLFPREKGGQEMRLRTERALRAGHTKKVFEADLCAKPDVVVGWGGEEWLLASVEVKKVKINDGQETFVLGSYRGQAAVNSFAVLNTCQWIKAVCILVNGAEYMFLEAGTAWTTRRAT
jgi:hypothetical protein